jgi:rubrerythrin
MKKGPSRAADSPVMKGLRAALRNEVDGAEFYRMAAESTRSDSVRQMFGFLQGEEERHRESILLQMERTSAGAPFRMVRGTESRRGIAKFRSPLFTEDLVKVGRQAEGEVAALSIGMTLEKRSIAQFIALRKKAAGDPKAEKAFSDLIAWEQDHLDLLTRQYDQLRELFWGEARFWPF